MRCSAILRARKSKLFVARILMFPVIRVEIEFDMNHFN